MTGEAVDHEALEQHFRDLDAAVELLGRRERLVRSAADLEDPAVAEETISLVALIALADGVLSRAENAVLLQLGAHVDLSAGRIEALVLEAANSVKDGLK